MSRKALVRLAQTLNKALGGRQPTQVFLKYIYIYIYLCFAPDAIAANVKAVWQRFGKRSPLSQKRCPTAAIFEVEVKAVWQRSHLT